MSTWWLIDYSAYTSTIGTLHPYFLAHYIETNLNKKYDIFRPFDTEYQKLSKTASSYLLLCYIVFKFQ